MFLDRLICGLWANLPLEKSQSRPNEGLYAKFYAKLYLLIIPSHSEMWVMGCYIAFVYMICVTCSLWVIVVLAEGKLNEIQFCSEQINADFIMIYMILHRASEKSIIIESEQVDVHNIFMYIVKF